MVPPLRLGFDVEDRDGNLVARDGTCDADWARELVQRVNVLGVPFKVEVARGAGGVLVVGGGLWSGGGDQLRVEAAATAKLAIRVRCAGLWRVEQHNLVGLGHRRHRDGGVKTVEALAA